MRHPDDRHDPDLPREWLLELAFRHGIFDEVVELLRDRPRIEVPAFADLLREQRFRRKMTLNQVHQRCRLARSNLAEYETRRGCLVPGLRTIQALAYGYKLPFWAVLAAAMKNKK